MTEVKQVEPLRGRQLARKIKTMGRVFDGEFLKFYYLLDRNVPTRTFIVVSKKHGIAVRRNLIKRWIREACRDLAPPHGETWGHPPSHISAFVMFKTSESRAGHTASFSNIKNDVSALRSMIQSLIVS